MILLIAKSLFEAALSLYSDFAAGASLALLAFLRSSLAVCLYLSGILGTLERRWLHWCLPLFLFLDCSPRLQLLDQCLHWSLQRRCVRQCGHPLLLELTLAAL